MLALERHRPGTAARFPVRDLIGALLGGDEEDAVRVASAVLVDTGSRTTVFADLLHPAQSEIGNLWYSGHLSYTDEVQAAAVVRRVVCRLPATPAPRPVPPGSRCMLATPHGDPHDLGLSMFALALQDHGWTTELLGPARRLAELAELVIARRPRFFGLSAGAPSPPFETGKAIAAIRRAGIPVLVGGVAFNRRPDLWHRLGVEGLGTDARIGVVLAERVGGR
jgi:methanogenic corrinoid protein MtbC1